MSFDTNIDIVFLLGVVANRLAEISEESTLVGKKYQRGKNSERKRGKRREITISLGHREMDKGTPAGVGYRQYHVSGDQGSIPG